MTIPNSVTEIGTEAFSGCTNLANVSLSKDVTMGGGVFWGTPWQKQQDEKSATQRNIIIAAVAIAVIVVVAAVVLLVLKKKGILTKKKVEVAAAKVSYTAGRAKNAVKLAGGVTCSCGTVNDPKVKFCANCGKPVLVPGRCPACGHQNAPDAKFCQGCGKPMDAGEG